MAVMIITPLHNSDGFHVFQILRNSAYPSVRSNAIIALGDLAFRFPNLIEPWTAHLYSTYVPDSIVGLPCIVLLDRVVLEC